MKSTNTMSPPCSEGDIRTARAMQMGDDKWRRYGEARRKALILQDEIEGNVAFSVNSKCRIHRYFEVAERVLKQFRSMRSSDRSPEEIYVMGCRLISFLKDALPKHPGFGSIDPEITELREMSLRQLGWMEKRVNEIALRIDEAELNQFILNDLQSLSATEMETSGSSSEKNFSSEISWEGDEVGPLKSHNNHHSSKNAWEDFTGWPDEVAFNPNEIDTSGVYSEVSFDGQNGAFPSGPSHYDFIFAEADSSNELDLSGSILNTLAYQDVRYETDSEAVDSWAQDPEASFQSTISNPHVTYDAARVAFHEIMKQVKLPSQKQKGTTDKDTTATSAWDLMSRSTDTESSDEEEVLGIQKFSPGSCDNVNLPFDEPKDSSVIQQEWVSFDSQEDPSQIEWDLD